MMRLIYNLLQLLFAPIILILLPVYLISRPEKCKTILPKLGYKLERVEKQGKSVIWIHALSVGEVTSVLPLVQRLNQEQGKNVIVVFSASTVSGFKLADQLLSSYCHRLIYSPFDILPVVRLFIKQLEPDLFILVETDFWPNLLDSLKTSNIPSILVNGRVSASSIKKYCRFRSIFRPLFNQIDALCMQTAADADKMRELGIEERKIKVVGNLKFADLQNMTSPPPEVSPFPENQLVILAGSTHTGEERILLDVFQSLRIDFDSIHLAIAPRNINRIGEIVTIVENHGFTSSCYSDLSPNTSDITLIDTIGDLSGLYGFGDICFIGGSLVDEGGHNPLEAARFGKVVLFGPFMDDFSEISAGLVKAGGAMQISGRSQLQQILTTLVSSESERTEHGRNGSNFVSRHQHVVADHMSIIRPFL